MSDFNLDVLSEEVPRMRNLLPLTNGFFAHMQYNFKEITASQLDLLLVSNIGARRPAPIVDVVHEDEWEKPFENLTDAELTKLAACLLSMKKPKWDKLGDLLELDYDPIHNYLDEWEDESDGTNGESVSIEKDRTDTHNLTEGNNVLRTDNLTETTNFGKEETRTDNLSETTRLGSSETRTDNLTETVNFGKSETRTDNLTELETRNLASSSTGAEDIYGFNSATASHANANSGSGTNTGTVNTANTGTQTTALSGSDTTNNTGTQTTAKSGSDVTENTGTQKVKDTGSDSTTNTGTQTTAGTKTTTGTITRADDETQTSAGEDHRERAGRHFGNIGNLTSQKMIKEEIDLWRWTYVNEILDDAKEFLSLPIYF